MKVLIVEDEPLAAERLEKILKSLRLPVEVVGVCSSVASAVEWIETSSTPDLGFFDIQLGDGTSFEIYDQTQITFPVIFTTAFDNFAIKAFKVNSVDYLLKPVEEEDLHKAITKYEQYHQPVPDAYKLQQAVKTAAHMFSEKQKYKERIVVNVGEHIRVVQTSEIACFYSEDKTTFLLTSHGRNFYLDQSLNQLEEQVNPSAFFRTSRKEIVNLNYITDIVNYGRSQLKVTIKTGGDSKNIIVSRERVKPFRNWLAGDH
ncbi:LytR/AlgR family response regulator transcription factor [Marinilabilia sp.]